MRRRIHVLLALALVTGVFAGAIGTASAEHDDATPGLGHQYLPWVPNGAELGDQGPYYGGVTVQNIEDEEVEVDAYVGGGEEGSGWSLEQTVSLAPRESITLSADALNVPEPGASVVLEGFLQREETEEVDDEEEVTQEAIAGRIAAVTKNVSPTDGSGVTTEEHEVVDGYTALQTDHVVQDVMPFGEGTYVVPITQTNDGWETALRVSNLSQDGGLERVTVTLYGSGGQGVADESEVINLTLDSGESETVTLSEYVSDEWTGSAFITSGADIGAVAERFKETDDMLLSTTSRPEHHADTLHAGALVFKEYNYWNTGISVANVDDEATNHVTITYIGPSNNQVAQDTLTIPPRGMEFVYTPGTQDLGLNDGFVGSVIINGSHELVANIDQVKYFGDDPDVGQAMSYVTAGPYVAEDEPESLVLPLAQKGNPNDGTGDTSGIQLFNPQADDETNAEIVFYGANGVPVAPTVVDNDPDPIEVRLPAQSNYTLYTHEQSELSSGFRGSVDVAVDDVLLGVSNNVNYDVQGDGSSAFNLIQTEPRQGAELLLVPEDSTNTVGDEHEVTATLLDQFGAPMPGETINFSVTASDGSPDPSSGGGETDANGEVTFSYTNETVSEDTITASHSEMPEVEAQADKTWEPGDPDSIILSHDEGDFIDPEADPESEATNPVDDETHTVYAQVLDEFGNPVADDTEVDFDVSVGGTVEVDDSALTSGGVAEFTYDGPDAPRTDDINASWDDDAVTSDNTLTKEWIAGDPASIVLSNEEEFETPVTEAENVVGDEHTVYAQVEDQFGNPVPNGTTIDFEVTDTDDESEVTTGTGDTTGGVATFTYDGPTAEPREDSIVASWDTDAATSNTVSKTWLVQLAFNPVGEEQYIADFDLPDDETPDTEEMVYRAIEVQLQDVDGNAVEVEGVEITVQQTGGSWGRFRAIDPDETFGSQTSADTDSMGTADFIFGVEMSVNDLEAPGFDVTLEATSGAAENSVETTFNMDDSAAP